MDKEIEALEPHNPSHCTSRTTYIVTVESYKTKCSRVYVSTRGKKNKVLWFSKQRYTDRNSLQHFIKELLRKNIAKNLRSNEKAAS